MKARGVYTISPSASSVVRRTEELGENIVAQLQQKAENFLWYSLAMNESIDFASTSQLLIFICGFNLDFKITEQLASVCSMSGTTNGEGHFHEVKKTLHSCSLRWNKLQCVTVDEGINMAGLKKGLVGRIVSQLENFHLRKALFCNALCSISASTLLETFGYFLRDETGRLVGELYLKSRINLLSIPHFT